MYERKNRWNETSLSCWMWYKGKGKQEERRYFEMLTTICCIGTGNIWHHYVWIIDSMKFTQINYYSKYMFLKCAERKESRGEFMYLTKIIKDDVYSTNIAKNLYMALRCLVNKRYLCKYAALKSLWDPQSALLKTH